MDKPIEIMPSGKEYPKEVAELYNRIKERMSNIECEELKDLVNDVYKIAYVDGFSDALVLKHLVY